MSAEEDLMRKLADLDELIAKAKANKNITLEERRLTLRALRKMRQELEELIGRARGGGV